MSKKDHAEFALAPRTMRKCNRYDDVLFLAYMATCNCVEISTLKTQGGPLASFDWFLKDFSSLLIG